MVDIITNVNAKINGFVWGLPMMVLILGVGIYLAVRCGFPQFAHFGHIMKNTLGKALEKTDAKEGSVSPFKAMCTALAASIGTGNIAGVSGAIALGGPGAVFWMWISALLGMCTKYAEVTLAIKYRERNEKGDWVGGPMYYIKNGLGMNWKWLCVIFAVFGALGALLGLRQKLDAGDSVLLTVDGPRGPRYCVHPGAAALSLHCGAPLVPMSINARHCWHAASWDRLQIPWPFTRVTVRFGRPLALPRSCSAEAGSEMLRQAMLEISRSPDGAKPPPARPAGPGVIGGEGG